MSALVSRRLRCLLAFFLLVGGLPVLSARADPGAGEAAPPTSIGDGSDFNGDGFADLAAGSESTLYIVYGSPAGLQNADRVRWEVSDVTGGSGRGRSFGPSATGDFDGDGFNDLALLLMPLTHPRPRSAKNLYVIYGSPTGLILARRTVRTLKVGTSMAVLASGNFGRGRFADLAVGDESSAASGTPGAGSVRVLYGAADGLASSTVQTWTQDSPGVLGSAEEDDALRGHPDRGSVRGRRGG